jgi:hypothetical protein
MGQGENQGNETSQKLSLVPKLRKLGIRRDFILTIKRDGRFFVFQAVKRPDVSTSN